MVSQSPAIVLLSLHAGGSVRGDPVSVLVGTAVSAVTEKIFTAGTLCHFDEHGVGILDLLPVVDRLANDQ